MRLARGGVEPLHCTMALYSLPRASCNGEGGKGGKSGPRAKVGEDFYWLAGEWDGIGGGADPD